MLHPQHRRYWYDGWQLALGLGSFVTAVFSLIVQPADVGPYLFAVNPLRFSLILGSGLFAALLWLPIAYYTWTPPETDWPKTNKRKERSKEP